MIHLGDVDPRVCVNCGRHPSACDCDEPYDEDEHDVEDEHDAWHPWWVEGCDACVDRADRLEQQRDETIRVDGDAL